VASAGHVVNEERLVGGLGVELSHVLDRLVRHVGGEVVAGLSDPWKDLGVIAEQIRRPLIGLAAHEAVKVLEAHPRRPLIEGARLAVLEGRRVVVLAEPRRGKAIVPEDRADGRVLRTDDGVIARVTGGQLANHAEAHRVVVAAGDERRPGGRAQRGGVEVRVAQPRLRDPVQRRRRDDASKRAIDAIALVVGHDEQHVGRAPGRYNPRRPPGPRILGAFLDDAAEFRRRRRKLLSVEGCDGVGRAWRRGGRLGRFLVVSRPGEPETAGRGPKAQQRTGCQDDEALELRVLEHERSSPATLLCKAEPPIARRNNLCDPVLIPWIRFRSPRSKLPRRQRIGPRYCIDVPFPGFDVRTQRNPTCDIPVSGVHPCRAPGR